MKVKKGKEFYAIVRKGIHSETLAGEDVVGRKIGPLRASRDSTSLGVASGSRYFCRNDFSIEPKL